MKPARMQHEVEEVRNNILDSALEIIVEEGFSALTMRRLAKYVGMTASNIYNYFSNKDEIYITLMIKGLQDLYALLSAAYQQHADPVQRSQAVILAYLKFGTDNSRYYDIMFSRSTPRYRDYLGTQHEDLSTREHQVSMQLAELAVTQVQELALSLNKTISESQAKLVLTGVWSLLHGMVSLRNSHNIEYLIDDSEVVYQQIVDSLMVQIRALL